MGDRYFLAVITWYSDGTRDTNICTTAGPELTQEEKDFIVEFLNTLQEGTRMVEVLVRARNSQPRRYEKWVSNEENGPWRTQRNSFLWMGSLNPLLLEMGRANTNVQQSLLEADAA